ncbi:MAG: RNA polymerase factor sigma-54 [Desulfuromonas thiophila]|jgi:RNA polymerase sigma-54 factor|nr:RNA polymerase factor sigma-54 [Desulfuromonas thiophila]MDD3800791.1 RNA polymerase factor sigma-54 [Desulfuromonas thiophila]MDY0398534.1 RNA polymerase factor sigma-54 [Desulfuromonas thiophila]
MAIELRQQLKLSQQLIMTPQLQQAIKLLQMSRLELEEVVNQELEENPVLEIGQQQDNDDARGDEAPVVGEAVSAAEEAAAAETTREVSEADGLAQIDDWQSYLQGFSQGGSMTENFDDDDYPSYENLLTTKTTLCDHLQWQLKLSRLPDALQQIGLVLIGNLDDNGYLRCSLDELAAQCQAELHQVEQVLAVVQQFDPPGVAARNLAECLQLQLRALGLKDSLAERIICRHARELEERRYSAIARQCRVSVEEVLDAARLLATLDPQPGSQFGGGDVHYITPDIFVHKVGDEYLVSLNDDGLANLRISSYYANLSGKQIDAQTNEYIQEKMRGALWLIKSIHQRQRTIYRVTKSIVKFQRDFFDHGISYLKPLVLRDVAEDVEMHESTISRVTTNKYVQTPQGLFELKYFFNSSINTDEGDTIASEAVKCRIRDLVAAENPKKPYSDQKIVELLRADGIDIARRTVTKYREMLGIRSSTARRRLF